MISKEDIHFDRYSSSTDRISDMISDEDRA
jgi:hypothetical protein